MPTRALRTEVCSTKVTERERSAVEQLAGRSELSVSEYLRALVQQAIKEGTVFGEYTLIK